MRAKSGTAEEEKAGAKIAWESSLAAAVPKAKAARRLIVMDFFDPG